MKKMHGLNTAQDTFYVAPVTSTNLGGITNDQYGQISVTSPDSPASLNTFLASQIPATEQFYIKRCYQKYFYQNNGTFPTYVQAWWFKCKKDIPSSKSVQSILSLDAVQPGYAFMSITTGEEARAMFKITKTKSKVLYPGKVMKFTVSRYFGTRKVLQEVDMDTSFSYRRGNRILLLKWSGLPQRYTTEDGPPPAVYAGTCLSPMQVNGVGHSYISYYKMNDITVDNFVGNYIPTDLPISGNNIALIGSNYHANTTTLPVDQQPVDVANLETAPIPTYIVTP